MITPPTTIPPSAWTATEDALNRKAGLAKLVSIEPSALSRFRRVPARTILPSAWTVAASTDWLRVVGPRLIPSVPKEVLSEPSALSSATSKVV